MIKPKTIIELQKDAISWPLYVSMIILSINSIVIGYSYYYAGITLPYHQTGTHGFIELTADQCNWYLSLHPLTILIGSVLCNPLGEKLGRKRVLMAANLVNVVSFTMMYFATNFAILLAGRLISGLSIGIGILMPFVLLSEISTIELRSGFANSVNLFISIGTLLAYVLNMIVSPAFLPFAVIGCSILFIAASVSLTESPHWLIRQGRMEEAENVFRTLRGEAYMGIQNEIKEVLNVLKQTSDAKNVSRWVSRTFLIPMGILILLFSTIGLCGLDAPLNLNGPRMFEEFGFHIPYQIIMLFIPAGSTVGYIVATPLMDRLRKRTHFILAALIMAMSTASLGLAYYTKDHHEDKIVSQIFMSAGALGLTFGYGVGLGSVVYALPGELLCPEDKTIGISIAHCCRMVCTAAVMKVYPFCLEIFGYPILFSFHTFVLVIAAVFVLRFLPETRNKSLSELQLLFQKNSDPADYDIY